MRSRVLRANRMCFSLLGLKISRNLANELGRSQSVLAELLESDLTFRRLGWTSVSN